MLTAAVLPVAAAAAAVLGQYAWLALTTGVMQLTTLVTFGAPQVGYSLAPFQLSTVIRVLLGHHVFRERDVRRRLPGSAIMAAGAMPSVTVGRG